MSKEPTLSDFASVIATGLQSDQESGAEDKSADLMEAPDSNLIMPEFEAGWPEDDDGEEPAEEAEGDGEALAQDEEPADNDEGEDQESESDEDDEESETPEQRDTVFSLTVNGEDIEFDVSEDPEETKVLLQKGKDYDRKTRVSEAIGEGLIKWDTKKGGYIVGHTVEQAVQQSRNEGMIALLKEMEAAGLPVKDDNDSWNIAGLVKLKEQAGTAEAPGEFRELEDEIEKIRQKAYKTQDAKDWEDLVRAISSLEQRRMAATESKKRAQEAKQKTRQQEIQAQWDAAYKRLEDVGSEYEAYFVDPFTDDIDKTLVRTTVDHAKRLLQVERDPEKAASYIKETANSTRDRNKAIKERLAPAKAQTKPKPKRKKKRTQPKSSPSTAAKRTRKGPHRNELRDSFRDIFVKHIDQMG
ncbi:MAG: hypothetical protein ACPHCN_15665 [Mycobacterium sp.]